MIVLLGALAVAVAALLGGIVGFSYALVALPLLLLVGVGLPDAVVTNLLVGLLTRIGVLVRHRRYVDRARVLPLLVGCLPGVLLAVLVRDSLPGRSPQVLAVAVVIASTVWVLLPQQSVRADRPGGPGRGALLATGVGSGFLAGATSLGGLLPAAVLNRTATSARTFRSELAAVLVVGNAMALVVLLMTSGPAESRLTPVMLVTWSLVGLASNAVGDALADRLPQRVFRRVVTLVVLGSGLVVLGSTILR